MNCPWDFLEPQIDLFPFCEQRLCSWVVEPSNAWTNIGYLIVALLIWRSREPASETKRLFFRSSLMIFAGSLFFHMSGSAWGKIADVAAMFVLSTGLLSLSLQRIQNLSVRQTEIFFGVMLLACVAFLVVFRFGNVLFAAQIVATLAIETVLWRGGKSLIDMKKVVLALVVLAFAFGIWILDKSKVFCRPDNHILSGHGLWHLLTALAIYLLYLSYSRRKS